MQADNTSNLCDTQSQSSRELRTQYQVTNGSWLINGITVKKPWLLNIGLSFQSPEEEWGAYCNHFLGAEHIQGVKYLRYIVQT